MTVSRKSSLLAAPGIAVSLLPKLACPACWPAYSGLLSSIGLGFLISTTYLFPLTAAFLAVSLVALLLRAKSRRQYGPFLGGLVAAIAVLLAKFLWASSPAAYSALSVLVAASVWSSWSRGTPNLEVTWEKGTTRSKKKVEIFVAGCPLCERSIDLVMRLVDSSHEVLISDMHRPEVAAKAEQYGVRTVPAVVIDGKLAACCEGRGCTEQALRSALS